MTNVMISKKLDLGKMLAALALSVSDIAGATRSEVLRYLAEWAPVRPRRITVGSVTAKAEKAEKFGVVEYVLHLPNYKYTLKNGVEVTTCRWADAHEKGCVKTCIAHTGRLGMDSAHKAMGWRLEWLVADPVSFLRTVWWEIEDTAQRATAKGMGTAVRMDATSNARWWHVMPWAPIESSADIWIDYDRSKKAHDLPIGWHIAQSANARIQSACEIVELWHYTGQNMSVIVDNPQSVLSLGIDGVVDADLTDMWMVADSPKMGLLVPKYPLKSDGESVFRSDDLIRALRTTLAI